MRRYYLIVGAGLVALFVVWRLVMWGHCSYYGWQTGRDVRYAAFIGCMVSVKDGWIPRDEMKVIQ